MSFTTTRLSSVVGVKTGFPLREAAKYDPSGDALLVQMKDVDPLEGVNWSKAIKINTRGRKHPEWLKRNDILFVGRGSRFFATRVTEPTQHSVASPHFYVLRNKNVGKALPEFLVWILNSRPAQKFYAANQEGSALPYISRKTLANLPVQLPDLETQKRIVDIYECWKRQKKLLTELTEQKEIYFNALLEKTLIGEAV